jgi:hypothetical protein
MAIPIARRWGQFPTIAAILDGDSAVSNGSIGDLSVSYQLSAVGYQRSAVSPDVRKLKADRSKR